MEFESFSAFLAMGKHGAYVWSSYGITLLVLMVNLMVPLRRKKQILQAIARKAKREQSEL